MSRTFMWAAALLLCAAITSPAPAREPTRQDARLITATQVLDELDATPDQGVPTWLLQRAYGIAVIPDVIKGAFIFGARHGSGVLTVRSASGRFSDPVFITLTGGSVGWQIGATSTDVVLVFTTQRGVQNFARGKFTLGVDASVAAGPVGRQGEASAGVDAEIYSYSRSRGLFAGVALDGTVLAFNGDANRSFYGREDVDANDITSGAVTTQQQSARRFIAAVVAAANGTGAPAAQAATTPPPAAPPAVATPAAAPASSGAQTFPLADPAPGQEPPR